MSLINDALKRTRQAQQQNPPPANGPALRPVEPAEDKSARGAKRLIYILVLCVVVGNALVFLAVMERDKKNTAAKAANPPTASSASPVMPAPPAPPAAAMPTPPTLPVAPHAPAEAVPSVVTGAVSAATVAVVETNAPAPAVVFENPKPAPLRLQSIIYNPNRPSAMIGGKFLFLGDRIQGFRVTAIDQETVTLVGNGQTNVLTLP